MQKHKIELIYEEIRGNHVTQLLHNFSDTRPRCACKRDLVINARCLLQ